MSPAVLLETPQILAVNKPAGVVVIPARDEAPEGSLWRALERARGERLYVVHRLDRDTSGVLLFARSAAAHRALCMAFEGGAVRKRYLAFTRGVPPQAEGLLDVPLHPARRGKMRPALPGEAGALPAQTAYRVLHSWHSPTHAVALLELRPRSGRQHQIRVHLRSISCPLLVDPLYGRGSDHSNEEASLAELGLGEGRLLRLPLHAAQIDVPVPLGAPDERCTIAAPLADDLEALRAALLRGPGEKRG